MWANRKTEQEIRREVARRVAEMSKLSTSQAGEVDLMHGVLAARNAEIDIMRLSLGECQAKADYCAIDRERLRTWATIGKVSVVVSVGALGAAAILMAR